MATTLLMSTMPPTGWQFSLRVSDEVGGERGGQVRVKQLGPDLWSGRFSSNQMPRSLMRQLKAIVAGLQVQRTTFYAWDPMGQYPKADPTGAKISTVPAATVQINSVNADNQRMSIKGLPSNYVLTMGDYLAFTYGSARALHQVAPPTTTVSSGATGITPEFWVVPRIRPGWSPNLTVTLKKPACEMLILPGTVAAEETPFNASIGFDALQVLP